VRDPAVLLTDARWRKALSAARALGRRGVRVLTADSTRLVATACSRYVERHLLLPPPAREPEAFVDALAQLAAAEPGLVVFPLEDDTLAAVAAARARLTGVALPIPPDDAIATALDKHRTTTHAAGLGVRVPRTVLPAGPDDLAGAAALVFPVVVKPRRGWGSQGVSVVETVADLPATYARVHATFPRPLVQERIPPGGAAHGVSCLFNARGALRAAFVHRRVREYPVTGGPSTLRVSVARPDLVDASTRLLAALGWTGFAMVEWKADPRDGADRLLEVNPRFVGSLELAVQAGVDFPWLLYEVARTGDCPEVRDYRVGHLCRWLLPGDLLHFLANPARFHLEPSFFRFRGPDLGYDDWARDDRRASLAQVCVLALQALRPSMWRYVRSRSTPMPS
jgi:predicted ATP-grasp superfamily ATP-dependent carboligase